MGYVNIFQKLDQDIANQLQHLQAQQKHLLEKKKNLLTTKQEMQKFLNSAQQVKKLVEKEPELMKSLKTELSKIFAMNNITVATSNVPKLPNQKKDNIISPPEKTIVSESKQEQPSTASFQSLSAELEEDSINDFNFVDAQGKNTSVTTDVNQN